MPPGTLLRLLDIILISWKLGPCFRSNSIEILFNFEKLFSKISFPFSKIFSNLFISWSVVIEKSKSPYGHLNLISTMPSSTIFESFSLLQLFPQLFTKMLIPHCLNFKGFISTASRSAPAFNFISFMFLLKVGLVKFEGFLVIQSLQKFLTFRTNGSSSLAI